MLLNIQTEDVYKDTSYYPKDHPLYNGINKKVLGKMKDECGGEAEEVVAVRPKMYSIKKADKKYKEGEGVKKNVIEKEITHEHYKEKTVHAQSENLEE